jgi:hypothetical protein
MDYYSNPIVERHLVGGALTFWEDFAPFADDVTPEFFSDPTLLDIWRCIAANAGDITALPRSLQPTAITLVVEYNGADPSTLVLRAKDAMLRRELQNAAVELMRAIDEDEPVTDIITRLRERLSTAVPADG